MHLTCFYRIPSTFCTNSQKWGVFRIHCTDVCDYVYTTPPNCGSPIQPHTALKAVRILELYKHYLTQTVVILNQRALHTAHYYTFAAETNAVCSCGSANTHTDAERHNTFSARQAAGKVINHYLVKFTIISHNIHLNWHEVSALDSLTSITNTKRLIICLTTFSFTLTHTRCKNIAKLNYNIK